MRCSRQIAFHRASQAVRLPAEFAAESAVNVGRAANVLARLQQQGYLDFRPNPAAEDMEMWALPLQDEDEARAEKEVRY